MIVRTANKRGKFFYKNEMTVFENDHIASYQRIKCDYNIKGEDVLNILNTYLDKWQLSWMLCVSICTVGAELLPW